MSESESTVSGPPVPTNALLVLFFLFGMVAGKWLLNQKPSMVECAWTEDINWTITDKSNAVTRRVEFGLGDDGRVYWKRGLLVTQ